MKIVDTSVLIYAINRDAPNHLVVKRWWEIQLSSEDSLRIPWVCILAFLRTTTSPAIFPKPMGEDRVLTIVDSWLQQPFVEALGPTATHWPILRNLCSVAGTVGDLTMTAHLASLALENGASICSLNYDYGRFEGVIHIDPLVEMRTQETLT